MADEKIKAEELKDEEMNKAAGGNFVFVDPTKKTKKCANPNCNTYLPYNYPDSLCKNCKKDLGGGCGSVTPIGRPKPIDLP